MAETSRWHRGLRSVDSSPRRLARAAARIGSSSARTRVARPCGPSELPSDRRQRAVMPGCQEKPSSQAGTRTCHWHLCPGVTSRPALRAKPRAENKAPFQNIVRRGPPPGLLAFDGGQGGRPVPAHAARFSCAAWQMSISGITTQELPAQVERMADPQVGLDIDHVILFERDVGPGSRRRERRRYRSSRTKALSCFSVGRIGA